ncbi:MAG TPA: ABC transporter ATP-binding protein [Gaiellales bacterium]|nr:ABC transporter ATP-binding protein [Gaiellales bacterium]
MSRLFGEETSGAVDPAAASTGRWGFLRDVKRVVPYLRPHWRLVSGSYLATGAAAGAALLAPWPVAIVIDEVSGKREGGLVGTLMGGSGRMTILAFAILGGFVLTALQYGLGVLAEYFATKLASHMTLDLRSDLFEHSQKLSQTFHDEARAGAMIYTINNAAESAGQVTVAFPPLTQAALTLIGMLVIAFEIDPLLAALSLSVVPFIYSSTGYYTNRIEPQLYRVRNIEHNSLNVVYEAVKMMRVITAFRRERHEYGRFREWAQRALHVRVNLTVRQTMFSMVVNLITAAGTGLVLWFGAEHVISGQLTPGQLLVMLTYVAEVYDPLRSVSSTLTMIQDQVISLRMAFGLLAHEPEVVERPDAVALPLVCGRVTYRRVGFRYPARHDAAVEGVSFDVRPGDRIGIVGPTGAGKSTLMSLLPRLHDADSGSVLIDGYDVRELTLDCVRHAISVVHQETMLFSGTIAYNILYGRLDASQEEMFAASRAANIHDFIAGLPNGYETELGEGGRQLSGGERQRIAIARAFLKDAPILILDEPTASLDLRTEGAILQALDKLMENRTTFLIAHRLSTLRGVDRVLVMDHGRLIEDGTPEQLVGGDGLYAQFAAAQTGVHAARSYAGSPS